MAEGQRLIDLPNDVMTNISSFLLESGHHMKPHNNEVFRNFQKKYMIKKDVTRTSYTRYGGRVSEKIVVTFDNNRLNIIDFLNSLKLNLSFLKSLMDYTHTSVYERDEVIYEVKFHGSPFPFCRGPFHIFRGNLLIYDVWRDTIANDEEWETSYNKLFSIIPEIIISRNTFKRIDKATIEITL